MVFEDGMDVDSGVAIGGARVGDDRLEDTRGGADGQEAARLGRAARETVGGASRHDKYFSGAERMQLACGLKVEAPFDPDSCTGCRECRAVRSTRCKWTLKHASWCARPTAPKLFGSGE